MLSEVGFEAAAAAVGVKRKPRKGQADSAGSVGSRITALWLQNQFSGGESLTYSPATAYKRVYLHGDGVPAHLCRGCIL